MCDRQVIHSTIKHETVLTAALNQRGAAVAPRFELYHSSISLSSQKVRAVFAHKSVAYRSHHLVTVPQRDGSGNLRPADNYDPSYIRLRMAGGERLADDYAKSWNGEESVFAEGFDPCAVPTLGERLTGDVVVDSTRIAHYLERACPGSALLMPPTRVVARTVSRQVEIVDQTPCAALLSDCHPDDDRRPEGVKRLMLHRHPDSIEALRRLCDDHLADGRLVEAYRAKLRREEGAGRACSDVRLMGGLRESTGTILSGLDRDLASYHKLTYGFGASLAHLSWGASLFRMKYLGLAHLWSAKPRIEEYWRSLAAIPATRTEVAGATLHSMPASPHLGEVLGDARLVAKVDPSSGASIGCRS